MRTQLKRAAQFVGLTFLFSWGLAFAVFASVKLPPSPGLMTGLGVVYMFIPMGVALIMQRWVCKEPIAAGLGISFHINRWFFVAWLLPAVLALAAWGVGLLIPGVELSWEMEGMMQRFAAALTPEQVVQMQAQIKALPFHPLWLALGQGLLAGATVNAVAGFGEELGWRGFLLKQLEGLGFWRSSLLIGLVWGIWHMPLILQGHNYPEHPQLGVFYMTYFTMLYAPWFSYIRLKAKSVIAAALLHGSLNGTVGVSFMVLKGGSDLSVGMTGLAGLTVLLVANIGLFLFDRFFAREKIITRCPVVING